MIRWYGMSTALEVAKVKLGEKASDVPELQEAIAAGCLDPNLAMNPFGEDLAIKPDGTPYRIADVDIFVYCDGCFNQVELFDSYISRAGGCAYSL